MKEDRHVAVAFVSFFPAGHIPSRYSKQLEVLPSIPRCTLSAEFHPPLPHVPPTPSHIVERSRCPSTLPEDCAAVWVPVIMADKAGAANGRAKRIAFWEGSIGWYGWGSVPHS